ncbi:MAG: 50S ribosomal protein L17 [Pseudomonadota bacterium]
MRHRRAGVHLSRPTAHRKALFSNLVSALLTNERIRTTDAKAKETRRLAERTITWARRLGDILIKKADRRTPDESARVVHAVRMARRIVRDRTAVTKLFAEIGPRYLARRGGYTRIVKIGQRPGDAAPMSLLELIPDGAPEGEAPAKADKAGKSENKGEGKAAKAGQGGKAGGKAPAAAAKEPAASRKKAPAAKGDAPAKKKSKSDK